MVPGSLTPAPSSATPSVEEVGTTGSRASGRPTNVVSGALASPLLVLEKFSLAFVLLSLCVCLSRLLLVVSLVLLCLALSPEVITAGEAPECLFQLPLGLVAATHI